MSKLTIGTVVVALAIMLSNAALGRGGGGHGGGHGGGGHGGGGHGGGHFHGGGGHGFHAAHFGGGHHIGGRFAFSHSASFRNAHGVRNALNSFSHAGALRHGRMLSNPAARAQIAAGAALAGWHNRGGANGWWQHGNGGYGWVGPVFWPFAYYDIYDYAIWGYGFGGPFWGYGYPDIYAGIFAPYGYDDLTGYFYSPRRSSSRRNTALDRLAQMCGDDSPEIAGLPIDQIQQVVEPTEAQRAALDDLANASISAAQKIRAACPTQMILTAPGRLAAMQARIEAMISAVATVQPALEKFYGVLDDEQKARLNAVVEDQRKISAAKQAKGSFVESCGAVQPAAMQWPTAEIEARLHLTDAQRASLETLQDASVQAADMLKASCQPDNALTPPARLTAVGKRLDTMLQAVKLVGAALEDFYATLSDEQKAQFEAIGPRRTS
jgi:LTXXQ motif family protein